MKGTDMRMFTADPAVYYSAPLPYRLVLNARGDFARFATFEEVLEHIAFTKLKAVAIVNDDRTDGDKRQGLSEDEYLAAIEVCQ